MKLYVELDTNNDSTLSREELVAGAVKLNLTKERANLLFDELDADQSGSIDQVKFPIKDLAIVYPCPDHFCAVALHFDP